MGDSFRQFVDSLGINYQESVVTDNLYIQIGLVDFPLRDFDEKTFGEVIEEKYRLTDLCLRVPKYFIEKSLSIAIHCKKDIFFTIKFNEFPNCCGKLLSHTFIIRENFTRAKGLYTGITSDWMQKVIINDTSISKITPALINLIKFVTKHQGYSSVSLILSQENPGLYEEMKKYPEAILVNSFKNTRNCHNIDEYTINI